MLTSLNSVLLLSELRQQREVEGYAFPYSVNPGETINFFVSSFVPFEVNFYRLSDMNDGWTGVTPLTPTRQYPAGLQITRRGAWQNGCNWKKTFSFDVPSDWSSDIYAAECRGRDSVHRIFFILRPPITNKSKFLVLSSTNTLNAYNDWGGYSRYSIDQYISATSFERPYSTAIGEFVIRVDLWLHRWLRVNNYKTDVISDQDFSRANASDLNDYAALILNDHPEYWTREMLDNLEAYLFRGGCLLYLGGNGIFEAVRYSQNERHLVFHDGMTMGAHPRDPFLFRNLMPYRPERNILGVAFLYENYTAPTAPYIVKNAEHWLFAGTGVQNNDSIGTVGIWGTPDTVNGVGGAASGVEMDTYTNGEADAGVICSAHLNTPDRGTRPLNTILLAVGDNLPLEGEHSSHMTCYDHQGGGFVFSVGSMCFTGSLSVDTTLQIVVRNALSEAMIRLSHSSSA